MKLATETTVAPATPDVPCTLLDSIPVSRLGFAKTLAQLGEWTTGDRFRRVATANLDFLELASHNDELREALCTADLVTADGQPLVWMSRLLDAPIEERVAGSDLAVPLLIETGRRGASVYLLGATPEVLETVTRMLKDIAPGCRVAGSFGGRVDLDDAAAMDEITTDVRESGADVLLVALGCPKQDLFLERFGPATGVKLGIGVGATLDFIAGERRRAPWIWQRLSLEWAYRMFQEPRRLTKRYARDGVYLARLLLSILLRRPARSA